MKKLSIFQNKWRNIFKIDRVSFQIPFHFHHSFHHLHLWEFFPPYYSQCYHPHFLSRNNLRTAFPLPPLLGWYFQPNSKTLFLKKLCFWCSVNCFLSSISFCGFGTRSWFASRSNSNYELFQFAFSLLNICKRSEK